MAKLVVQEPGKPVTELDLPPGLHQVGRSPSAHFQINHPSVSGAHCQIAVLPDGATIKDLGSTNGTWMDGQRIEEKPLLSGQHLRLGDVDVVFESEAKSSLGIRLATTPGVVVSAPPAPPTPPPARLPVPRPVAAPPQSFYQYIPDAFAYPLKHWGALTLAAGSVVFLGFNMLPRMQRVAEPLFFSGDDYGRGLSMFFRAAFARSGFGLGIIFNALCGGYVFLFMQSIITASANGEDRMPSYPLLESWWYDGVEPYLKLLLLLACCLASAVLCRSYLPFDAHWLTVLLGIAGFAYFSMALLAISLCDSMKAMSPAIVLPSICRIPWEYATYCLIFLLLTGASMCSGQWLEHYPILPRQFRIYQLLAAEFFFLYTSAVEMRLLGLLYYTGRERLAWKA